MNCKGLAIVCAEPDTTGRVVSPPEGKGVRTGVMPLPFMLMRYGVTDAGKPQELPELAGFVDSLTLVGNEVHCAVTVDTSLEAGRQLAGYLGKQGSVALAPDFDDITESLLDFTSAVDVMTKPPELLSWKLRAVYAVHDDYAPWARARLYAAKS